MNSVDMRIRDQDRDFLIRNISDILILPHELFLQDDDENSSDYYNYCVNIGMLKFYLVNPKKDGPVHSTNLNKLVLSSLGEFNNYYRNEFIPPFKYLFQVDIKNEFIYAMKSST